MMHIIRHTVQSSDDLVRLYQRIADMPHPFTVKIAQGLPPSKRTDAMNRTIHGWFAEIAQHFGDRSPSEVKAECNLVYGVPILLRDDQEWSACFGYIFDALNAEVKKKAIRILDIPITRNMTVKQLCEYMDQMQRDYLSQGVRLTDPEAQ